MIRAEAETCFETKYENKYFDATLAFDDLKFCADKGPNNQKHNEETICDLCIRLVTRPYNVLFLKNK